MNIDIEKLKIKVANHLCKVGHQSTKECSYLYKMGQALEQLQAELDKTCVNFEEYVEDKKSENEQQNKEIEDLKLEITRCKQDYKTQSIEFEKACVMYEKKIKGEL